MRDRTLRVIDGVLLFYLGCAGFRLLAYALLLLGIFSGMLVQSLGGKRLGEYLAAIGYYGGIAGSYLPVMLVFAALFVALVAWRAGRRRAATTRASASVTLALAAGCALVAVADARYGMTPLAQLLPQGESPVAAKAPALALAPHDFMNLRDAQVGLVGEVTGVLEYHERMHRFALRDTERRESVYVYFHRGGRSPFDESFGPPQPPRYYADVAPYVGRTVRVKGTVTHSQVDVDVRDIVALDGAAAVSK